MVAPAVCEPAAAPSATLRASCSQLSPIPESPRALLLASPGPRLLDSPIRNNPQQQQQQLVQQNAALVAEVEDLKVRLSLAERASAWCGASPAARALFRWRRRTSLTREHGRMATSLQNWEEQLLAISDELSASAASLCQQLAEVHRESAALARESTASPSGRGTPVRPYAPCQRAGRTRNRAACPPSSSSRRRLPRWTPCGARRSCRCSWTASSSSSGGGSSSSRR